MTVRKTWAKSILAVLCVILLNMGVWGCVLFGLWENNVPQNQVFYESNLCWRLMNDYADMAEEAYGLQRELARGNLTNFDRQRLTELEEKLDAPNTNFRFIVQKAGKNEILYENVDDIDQWKKQVYDTHFQRFVNWEYSEDSQYTSNSCELVYGVAWPLTAEDDFARGETLLSNIERYAPTVLGLSITCIVVSLILLILLMRVAGRRPDREEVILNWHDKIPYDLYLALQAGLISLSIFSIAESLWYVERYVHPANVAWLAGSAMVCSIFGVALLLTTATRIKARTIFRNTVIWRLCSLLWRGCKAAARGLRNAVNTLPLVWRIVVLFAIYLVGALLTTILFAVGVVWFAYDGWAVLLTLLMIVAIPAWHGFALFLLCRWALQWKQMRAAAQEIVSGKTDVKIESEKFYPDLKEHAEQLNDLGGAIDNAVNERMKSERFKSELITNVSHDLKTPLTSIINYVDLLKKEDIENPTAQEYIEVLDRKSQRLKKLTEDLVEASKASTGALTVNKDDLDLVQLIRQALGEYEEKLTNAGLSLVTNLPEGEIRIRADGRHVWRVLDNLLNNCVKYALEGTRVYLDAAAWNGNAVIIVKNISRNPLNVPAEQLVERFVRGDESRATEGSGLGLSIARSLTELQGGQFSLDIDGDLFKAKVAFPLKEV